MGTKTFIPEINELRPLVDELEKLRDENALLMAILFGSFAKGKVHPRSDIDLALYLNDLAFEKEIEVIDRILMSVERDINILRLDDEEESPFVIQEALKGIHLIEPDWNVYYKVADRVLHETETIRFRRGRFENLHR
jgi:predicted nucleotidyltransferase